MKKLLFVLLVVSTTASTAQQNFAPQPSPEFKKQVEEQRAQNRSVAVPEKRQIIPLTGKALEARKEREARGVVIDTRFHCVKGDWSAPVPGKCPKHNENLLKDTDPTIGDLIYEEGRKNKDYGFDHKNAEDHPYICMEGDFTGYSAGKCPNHPNSELLSTDNPQTIVLMQQAVKKNPDHFSKMVKAEDIKYACVHTDYVDFTPGKCPKHNLDLLNTNNPDFIKKSAAVNVKQGNGSASQKQ